MCADIPAAGWGCATLANINIDKKHRGASYFLVCVCVCAFNRFRNNLRNYRYASELLLSRWQPTHFQGNAVQQVWYLNISLCFHLMSWMHLSITLFILMQKTSSVAWTRHWSSSPQRLDTPTPAWTRLCTWGRDSIWTSTRTGCRPSTWPRATSLACVSVLMPTDI